MVNKSNDEGIKSVDDLKDKKVAVEKGTASHTYASKNLSDADLEVHDTITTAYESLEQKKVDAVIQDGPGANLQWNRKHFFLMNRHPHWIRNW